MSEFNLATGSVLFKGDMSQFEEDLKVGKAKLADLNKSLMTGGFKFQLYAAKSFNDELAKANKQAKRLMDEVKYGKGGLWMKEFGEKFKVGFDKFQSVAKGVAVGGLAVGGAALTAGAGGSPLAASTLEGSWKLLMTEIGGTFTPLVKDVSRGLQDLRNTWRGFSDETKKLINEGAKLIGIAGLAAAGLAAVSKGLSVLAKHPFIALLSGGAAVLYAGQMKEDSYQAKQSKNVGEAQRLINGTTAADAERGWQGQRLASMEKSEAQKEAHRLFRRRWDAYENARKEYESVSGLGWNGQRDEEKERKSRLKVVVTGKELEEAKYNLEKYGGTQLPRKKQGAGGGQDMLLGAAASPSMLGVQELFKTFQMAGMGTSQLEAEQKRVEQENQIQMLENTGRTAKILEEIKRDGLKMGK